MLAERIGAVRMLTEGPSAERIVAACAGLPLALAIAAARVQESEFALDELANELSDEHARLDALDTGDPAGQVRAVFSWSYHALPVESRRLFRLAGIHPGPDLTVASMASLAGADEREVRQLLRTLSRTGLLSEPFPGRYVCHSLLRSYAAELAARDGSDADRQEALPRLVEHYVVMAYAAARLLAPAKCELPSWASATMPRPSRACNRPPRAPARPATVSSRLRFSTTSATPARTRENRPEPGKRGNAHSRSSIVWATTTSGAFAPRSTCWMPHEPPRQMNATQCRQLVGASPKPSTPRSRSARATMIALSSRTLGRPPWLPRLAAARWPSLVGAVAL